MNWAAMGLAGGAATKIEAPQMTGVQGGASFHPGAGASSSTVTLPVEAAAGWLLIVS